METFIADLAITPCAVPVRPAGFAAPSPSPQDLRSKLGDSIAARIDADNRAAKAAGIAGRAEAAMRAAAAEVARLEAGRDAEQAQAVRALAERLTQAFREGETLPGATVLPKADSAALGAAAARLDAIKQSAGQLTAEAATARQVAADAVAAVRSIADQIIAADARALASEWIAATRLCWELQDKLTALATLGGDFLPNEFQAQLLGQIDRRRNAISENSQMAERYNFDAHLDKLTGIQERAWLDYGRRLANDASAAFDVGAMPQ